MRLADVGGEADIGVAEIDRAPQAVGQAAVRQYLHEHVEHAGMTLLDLVEQANPARILAHAVGQDAAGIEALVARRRADQLGHRVLLHVLAHVEAQQVEPEQPRHLLPGLGLADAGGAKTHERDGRAAIAPAALGNLDAVGDLGDRRRPDRR